MQFIMALKMNLKKQKKNQTITISKALFTNGLRFNDVIKKVEIIDTSR